MAYVDKTKIHQGPGSLWLGVAVPATGARLTIDVNGNPTALALAAPAAPALSSVAGGSLAAATYYVKATYVNILGETTPSAESSLAVAANNLPQVATPPVVAGATGWNVYIATAAGQETLQNAAPLALGQAFVLPATGLVAGLAAVPAANSAGPVFAGAVSGATTVLMSPKIETIAADQVTAPIDARLTAEEESIEADIMETDYARFRAYVANGVYATGNDTTLPAGFQTYEEISFGGLLQIPQLSVAVISPRQEAPGKFIVSQLYNAYQAQALSVPFSKEKPSTVKVKFVALALPSRVAGDQVGKIYRQP